MGINDRDYYQQRQPPGPGLRAPQSMVITLIIINVAAFLANGLLTPPKGPLDLGAITNAMAAHWYTLFKPWMWWQFLTYGFAHGSIEHILFNMLGLFFLGRHVERLYGRWEFLRIYLLMIVLGSVVYAVAAALLPQGKLFSLVGASGAISGVVLLFILNFPRVTLVLFPIPIPVKAWVLGVLLVVFNVYGAVKELGNVAYGVHLVGMAFAYVYFANHWNLGRLFGGGISLAKLKPKPKLRIHDPEIREKELREEVDRILEKIHREGEASLTKKERRTLEVASREFQRRR